MRPIDADALSAKIKAFFDTQNGKMLSVAEAAILSAIDEAPSVERHDKWTGLTDKKRKDIFEGDICLFVNDDGDHTNYLVEWQDNKWMIQAQMNGVLPDEFDRWFANNCEVIGNIHGNPELLYTAGEDNYD